MDVYSFLDSVLQSENGGGLKEIESRHKLSLAEYDSSHLESFTWELPKVFRGSLTTNTATVKGSIRSSFY